MTDACVIRVEGTTAGIAVAEQGRGHRFFATQPACYPIDNTVHTSVDAIRQAASKALAFGRTRPAAPAVH